MKNLFKSIIGIFTLALMALQLSAQSPVVLTSASFNFDAVAESSPATSTTTNGMDLNNGSVLYAPSHPNAPAGTGMPSSGTVTDGAITYNLQSYSGNNALFLNQAIGSSGTMHYATPAPAETIHFLATSGNGDYPVNITVNFSDNTSEQIATGTIIDDWFNNNPFAFTTDGVMVRSSQAVNNPNSGNPRLYSYSHNISLANQSKNISSIEFTKSGGSTSARGYVFAVASTVSAPIPTMGEWALITLALIILSIGLIYVMRWKQIMLFQNAIKIIPILALFFLAGEIQAQCTINFTATGYAAPADSQWGQSFTADCDGLLTQVTYETYATQFSANSTMNIYEGNGCGGTLLGTATFDHNGTTVVNFSPGIDVTQGNQYTWFAVHAGTSATALFSKTSGSYAGGHQWWGSNCDPITWKDSLFSVTIEEAPAIPTMNEWALIIFGLLILSMGTITVMQWQKTEKLQATFK